MLVKASDDSSFGISVDAEQSVRRAIKASITGDQLNLETQGNFRTQRHIKVSKITSPLSRTPGASSGVEVAKFKILREI